ncbi:insulin-like peptide INSL6 [Dasypus novemcinctus]|uniref:insulin-like peptide INSL6 n=1 Tax=Dasypus novemcinctus TaxID=9361 RepID=UPI000328D9BC|nr:insulin-like peptide INSL6 [Dasypus novemcinctus]
MRRLLCCSVMCLLLLGFSLELGDINQPKKLCGRHLLREIEKLCGTSDWSQFGEETPFTQLIAQAAEKAASLIPDGFESSPAPSLDPGTGLNPVSTTAFLKKTNIVEMQSLPEYQSKKANLPPAKKREFSSLHDINSYIHEIVEFEKKNTNKIKTLHNLFWGNHHQRKRRGYSEKCCLKGCTKRELSIACIPYIDFKNVKGKNPAIVTELYKHHRNYTNLIKV